MLQGQQRLARLEDENLKLADPVQLPDKQGRPSYFFRPPMGFGPKGTPDEDSSMLQRFVTRPGTNTPFQYVAFGVERVKAEDFWSSVLRTVPGKKTDDAKPVVKETPGRGKLSLYEVKDGAVQLYVWSNGDSHAAVVFRLARTLDDDTAKLIDLSLGTLTIGTEAARLQRAFHERKKLTSPGTGKKTF
jgi:hypothetical protein